MRTELLACSGEHTTKSAFTLIPVVILEVLAPLVTWCHGLFNRFWKLAYLNFSVWFSFLEHCVILWCFLPASASHRFYHGLPYSERNLPALTGSDATALPKWRFASTGLGLGLCISRFLSGTIALNKEGQMQSLFYKAYQKLLLLQIAFSTGHTWILIQVVQFTNLCDWNDFYQLSFDGVMHYFSKSFLAEVDLNSFKWHTHLLFSYWFA